MKITTIENLARPSSERIARVFVNDVDVTLECHAIDADAGIAVLFDRDEDGKFIIDGGEVRKREIKGTVRLEYEGEKE